MSSAVMIEIASFGKIKNKALKTAFEYYLQLANRKIPTAHVILKESRALQENEQVKKESLELEASLGAAGRIPLLLDTRGELMDSLEFSRFINRLLISGRHPRFHVGNFYGIPEPLKKSGIKLISLGPLTMSHELALVVLAEQIYRAGTLLFGGQYHR
ncbi:23S rRNA (pseudouridine(1915)-N(3))-methyltransferase RlmH [Candidatus Mcinerneyibacteriota bacterium]|nr:23S rRNA (pseudouridine(1915)-N(3))-methyltransferase RlmH [Candidatus Mcinerneyibacteriota bacterium]